MKDLQVPTRRVHVEAFVSTGERVVGSLFMHESPYQTGHAEDLIHELHDERCFLPLATDESRQKSFVINKEHILRLHVPWSDETRHEQFPAAAGQEGATAELLLSDGSRIEGRLVLVTPANASRIVDKLNLAPTFVLFATASGLEFVRRSHIVHAS